MFMAGTIKKAERDPQRMLSGASEKYDDRGKYHGAKNRDRKLESSFQGSSSIISNYTLNVKGRRKWNYGTHMTVTSRR